MKNIQVSHITVVREVLDDVFLHVEGVKSPIWPFKEGLTLRFQSASEKTSDFLEENWPGVRVEIVTSSLFQRDSLEETLGDPCVRSTC